MRPDQRREPRPATRSRRAPGSRGPRSRSGVDLAPRSIAVSARGRLGRQADEPQPELLVLLRLRGPRALRASGRVPDWVLGKAMTSRMFVWPASSAAQRSMPSAIPPWGGAPYSKASRTAPNFSRMPSMRLALEQEAALEEVAAMDPDRTATELPAVEREVVLERPGPAGRVLRRRSWPDRRTPSRAAPRPRARRR